MPGRAGTQTVGVTTSAGTGDDEQATGIPLPTESLDLSEFATKLLDQLSVTSWLPAAMLTANGALLVSIAVADSLYPVSIGEVWAKAPTGATVTSLLLALVFATMMTQSFELGACQYLQGRTRLPWPIGDAMVWLQRRRLRRLRERRRRLIHQSWPAIRVRLLDAGMPHRQTDALEVLLLDLPREEFTQAEYAQAAKEEWQPYIDSAVLVRWRALNRRIREYPDQPPIMPTMIGNVFRRLDDELRSPARQRPVSGEDFLFMEDRAVPNRLVLHYRTAKNRLDMHCTMVFGFVALAAASTALLADPGVAAADVVVVTGGYVLLALLSYAAALRITRHFAAIARIVAGML